MEARYLIVVRHQVRLELKGKPLVYFDGRKVSMSDHLRKFLCNDGLGECSGDVIARGIEIFERRYLDGFDGQFKLFERYSRSDVCRLLGWNSVKHVSAMYGYRVYEDTCPIFVSYDKSESISKSIQYDDKFMDGRTFSWMSRNNRSLKSREIKSILGGNCKIHLFVQKGDDDSSDFYCMGLVRPISSRETTIEDDNGKEKPIVNIVFKMEKAVPEGIYDYITGILGR